MYFRDHRLLYIFTKHYYVPEAVLNPVVRKASEGDGWQVTWKVVMERNYFTAASDCLALLGTKH